MTEAAQRFLRSFEALPQTDQHEVLASLLRMPLEAKSSAPGDDDLLHAADQIFLGLDRAELGQGGRLWEAESIHRPTVLESRRI